MQRLTQGLVVTLTTLLATGCVVVREPVVARKAVLYPSPTEEREALSRAVERGALTRDEAQRLERWGTRSGSSNALAPDTPPGPVRQRAKQRLVVLDGQESSS